VVIGFGAHADPAGQIAAVLAGAPATRPYVVASVTGTEDDPQVRSRQVAALQSAGVLVAASNAGAAELALTLARR
jgi:FdrA protein